jgi:hypothetical protein
MELSGTGRTIPPSRPIPAGRVLASGARQTTTFRLLGPEKRAKPERVIGAKRALHRTV